MTNTNKYLIRSLGLSGFRAYLHPTTFSFAQKRSLAIFARNGTGKSSFVDAFEFLLSSDGTLLRLGLRRINNSAGVEALAHAGAAAESVESFVSIEVVRDGTVVAGIRQATGTSRPRPAIVSELAGALRVTPIIRGYELRDFVEKQSAEERYESVSGWLQLAPLVEAQRQLRNLRQRVKAEVESNADLADVDKRLAATTGGVVTAWDDEAVLAWWNEQLKATDPSLSAQALQEGDAAFAEVLARAKNETEGLGLDRYRHLRSRLEALAAQEADPEGGEPKLSGSLRTLSDAEVTRVTKSGLEEQERAAAATAVFAKLWEEAEPHFRKPESAPELCPVCTTPLQDGPLGGAPGIHEHLRASLAVLKSYSEARKALEQATKAASSMHQAVITELANLKELLVPINSDYATRVGALHESLTAWSIGEPLDVGELIGFVLELGSEVDRRISAILNSQGESSYSALKVKGQALFAIAREQQGHVADKSELASLSAELTRQSAEVSLRIRGAIQGLLNDLEAHVNHLYQGIQGTDAKRVRIQLPPEGDTNQQRLQLLVDFAENRMGVPPSGYLSDSQVHSLALALRVAAIARFNHLVPLVVLDDVVTSYDAEHRRALAAMIATEMKQLQVVIVTHDERFFSYLKDQVDPSSWQFKRILFVETSSGPRFADHMVSDELIESRWQRGENAANEMRQAEEEWLLQMCRDFGAEVRIRSVERAYSYERAELAVALAGALKAAGLTPPAVPGVSNRFLTSLQQGVVENFGSHFQDSPFGDGSIGDEKARWREFTYFREQFVCGKCGRKRFKRPMGIKRPLCNAESCESPFEFGSQSQATLSG